jgi:hypothetical protein
MPPAAALTDAHLRDCRVVPDRLCLLEKLPKHGVVAEVGVLAGDFSASILEIIQPSKLLLIDSFGSADWAWTGRFTADQHLEFVRSRFKEQRESGQVEVIQEYSWDALAALPEHSLDLAYIDAGHDYDSARKDLEAARHAVSPTGVIVMNDYIMFDTSLGVPYGVVHATNEFCLEHGWEMFLFALQSHLFNDVALRKIS